MANVHDVIASHEYQWEVGDIVQVYHARSERWNYHTTIHDREDAKIAVRQIAEPTNDLKYRVVRGKGGENVVLG